jgi:hypothetical protein
MSEHWNRVTIKNSLDNHYTPISRRRLYLDAFALVFYHCRSFRTGSDVAVYG